jgi:hypothetical protein
MIAVVHHSGRIGLIGTGMPSRHESPMFLIYET